MDTTFTTPDVVQKHYDKVFSGGKLTNVHIGMWSMSCTLEEKDVLIDTALPDTIRLGKKMLIKPVVYNKFKCYEGQVRRYLYENSFAFPLVAQAHFVPKVKFRQVYNTLCNMRVEFMALVEEFLENYEAYKAEALEHYEAHKDQVSAEGLEAKYPTVEELGQKFYFDVMAYEVAFPTNFSETDLHTEIARDEAVSAERAAAAERYQAQYKQQLATHMTKIEDFTGDVISTLRQGVIDLCTVAASKVNKKEVLPEKGAKHILGQIAHLREMNFIDDAGINAQLASLEGLLNGEADLTTDKAAVALLQQHLTNTVNTTKELSDVANVTGEYFRKLRV